MPLSPQSWHDALTRQHYIPTTNITTALALAQALEKPLLVEGPPGAGKTYLAHIASQILDAALIRLQCYEGIDASKALYEYHYGKQLLYLNVLRERVTSLIDSSADLEQAIDQLDTALPLWGPAFLLRRPVFEALAPEDQLPRVLLVDEVDRADREFEALLLEPLSDWSLSIPEYGTVMATQKPLVILTSNRTRDLSDALRRRCLYLWIDLPDRAREAAIIQAQVADASQAFAGQLADFLGRYRQARPHHVPSIAEAVELATALCRTSDPPVTLSPDLIDAVLPIFAKHPQDLAIGHKTVEALSHDVS